MKAGVGVFLVCVSLLSAESIHATTLPDACGKDSVKFSVTTQKDQAQPAGPSAGEAQIVFIEAIEKNGISFCFDCDITTRVGVDGAWVGANQGNSYFVYNLPSGEHHLCANWQSRLGSLDKNVGVDALDVEPGKVYYFQTKVMMEERAAGQGTTARINRLYLKQLKEDEGEYLVKISALSTSKAKK